MAGDVRNVTVAVRSEDGILWAEVVDMPGCFATGRTSEELLSALEEAISLYLTEDPDQPVVVELKPCDDLGPVKRVPARLAVA